jgi:hypothetical protein
MFYIVCLKKNGKNRFFKMNSVGRHFPKPAPQSGFKGRRGRGRRQELEKEEEERWNIEAWARNLPGNK